MTISSVGSRPSYSAIHNRVQSQSFSKSFLSMLHQQQEKVSSVSSHSTVNQPVNITLIKGEDVLMSEGRPDGSYYAMYRAEESTDLDPVILVKGRDESGNDFETKIHINQVDLKNASHLEMVAAQVNYQKSGQASNPYDSFLLMHISTQMQTNLSDKINYPNAIQSNAANCFAAHLSDEAQRYLDLLEQIGKYTTNH